MHPKNPISVRIIPLGWPFACPLSTPMLNSNVLIERVDKWLSPIYWTDCNIRSAMYGCTSGPSQLLVYEPEEKLTPNVTDVMNIGISLFRPAEVGQSFGPSWTTKWFFVEFHVPAEMEGQCVALRWNSSSEAMLYDSEGRSLQGFTGSNGENCRDLYIISQKCNFSGSSLIYYVEMACNELFGNGNNGMIFPPNEKRFFNLSAVELVVLNSAAHSLFWDVKVMYDLITELKKDHPVSAQAIGLLTQIINTTNITDQKSIAASRKLLENSFFSKSAEFRSAHEVTALGHCHIDTAWLWTYSETRRKIVRSWSTQLELLKSYSYKFVASQTVHFEWLKEDNIELYSRIKDAVRVGTFLPVGGSYVEFDANMPSGESIIRQLLYGTQFLEREFQQNPKVFWLPDTFGYSAQLPQILQGFEIPYFLSQKLSWNLYNK